MSFTPILNEKSVLNNLPSEVKEDQILILDSIRFTIEMLDFNYSELCRLLLRKSESELESTCKASHVFSNCWSIIDHAARFYKLYKQFIKDDSDQIEIEKLNYIIGARNTFQHIDERVKQIFLENSLAIYGQLRWVYHDHKEKRIWNYVNISGIVRRPLRSLFPAVSYDNQLSISDIYLLTVNVNRVRDKETKNWVVTNKDDYICDFDISGLYETIREIIYLLESEMDKDFEKNGWLLQDWSKLKDIVICAPH